jgi:hypothetical protein
MNRIIVGTADKTRELNNYYGNTVAITGAATIYIGSLYRFNHLYFDLPGTEASAIVDLTISLYGNGAFNSVANIIDETFGFSQSGFITFTPDPEKAWENRDTKDITEMNTLKIADMFWVKITGTFTGLEANWVGNIFSTDEDLGAEFYYLTTDAMKDALGGVKSHLLKHIRAASLVIGELKSKNVIKDKSYILERRDLMPASVQKVAEMIFNELGDAYKDKKETARSDYYERLKKLDIAIDIDGDSVEDRYERSSVVGELMR